MAKDKPTTTPTPTTPTPETPKKTMLFDNQTVEIQEETPEVTEKVRYQVIYGASKVKKGIKLADLTDKERKDIEKYEKLCSLASIFYGKTVTPNARGSTKAVKTFVDFVVQRLTEKGSIDIKIS